MPTAVPPSMNRWVGFCARPRPAPNDCPAKPEAAPEPAGSVCADAALAIATIRMPTTAARRVFMLVPFARCGLDMPARTHHAYGPGGRQPPCRTAIRDRPDAHSDQYMPGMSREVRAR